MINGKKLKFLTVEDIDNNPDEKHRWYDGPDKSFYRSVLAEKFPKSQLIVFKDSCDIGSYLNTFVGKSQEKILAAKKNYNEREQEHYERSRKDRQLYTKPHIIQQWDQDEEDKVTIDTDVSGIIFPARHADWSSDMGHLLKYIKGSFEIGLNKKKKKIEAELINFYHSSNLEDEITIQITKDTHEYQIARDKYFYKRFEIPVFETWKTVPGYRLHNEQLGVQESMEDRLHLTKFAYERWLELNFNKDDSPFWGKPQLELFSSYSSKRR